MDQHFIDDREVPKHERELTLSTGSILAIFLGLAVLCGGFFGFGYNMGRKSAPTPLNLSDVATEPTLPSNGASKPAAGSPLDAASVSTLAAAPVPKPVHKAPPPPPEPAVAEDADTSEATAKPVIRTEAATPAPAPVVRAPTPVSPAALSPSAAAPTVASTAFVVQVAAVSHKDDADLLVGALRARGYAVSARSSTGDSFIHVQIGPFHDKKEADAMRQRLLTDGYNAIVKQ